MTLETEDAKKLFLQFKNGGLELVLQLKEIKATEGQILDFKRAQNNGPPVGTHDVENLARAISGFANSEGGVLVWGVDCARKKDCVSGFNVINNVDEFRAELFKKCNQVVKPKLQGIQAITIYSDESDETGFVVLFIPKSKHIIESTLKHKRGIFERANDSFTEIDPVRLQATYLDQIEAQRAVSDDLDQKLLREKRTKHRVIAIALSAAITCTGGWLLIPHLTKSPPPSWKSQNPKNLAEAKQLYEPYAATDAEAQVRLACAYYFLGDGSEANRQRTVQLFEEAAKRTNPIAQYNLATLYIHGDIPIDENNRMLVARDLYAKASESKFPPASIQLAIIDVLSQEQSLPANLQRNQLNQLECEERAAHILPVINKSIEICMSARNVGGRGYLYAARLTRFKILLDKAASTNFLDRSKIGIDEARKLYEKSYELGCAEAAYNLFVLYSFQNNTIEAHRWLVNATDQSLGPVSPVALTALGQAYEHGKYGFKQDVTEALRLYTAAANKNYPPALFKYAKFLQENPQRDSDTTSAISLYERLTTIVDPILHKDLYSAACNNLGVAYWQQALPSKGAEAQQLERNANNSFVYACQAKEPNIPNIFRENLTYIFTVKPKENFRGTRYLLPSPILTGLRLIDFDDDFWTLVVHPDYLVVSSDVQLELPPDLQYFASSREHPSLPTNHP